MPHHLPLEDEQEVLCQTIGYYEPNPSFGFTEGNVWEEWERLYDSVDGLGLVK